MLNTKKTALFVLTIYLSTLFTPPLAYASQSSVQQAADALSIMNNKNGTVTGDTISDEMLQNDPTNTDIAVQNEDTDNLGYSKPIAVNERLLDDDTPYVHGDNTEGNIRPRDQKQTPEKDTIADAKRLNPREIYGTTMFDNLQGELKRFGSDFFSSRRINSLEYAPVGPNYIVAPGDEVKVNIWGYAEIRANLIVNRDGMITLPQAGAINVAGLSFAELQKTIESAYKKLLTDFNISVTMGKLHAINVYVTGHAAHPGSYAVSSMATLVDVISQAGGPALSGTMRAIAVKRNNKKIASFDAYNLLLKGDRKGDVRLADGDIIFIPPVGSLVSVAGNVKRPAIYELTAKENKLTDVLALAGGITARAYKGRIQLVRTLNSTIRTAFESDLNAPEAKVQRLQDGDLLKIFAVPGEPINVRVAGAVAQPGIFAIESGTTTLSQIIKRAGGLLYTAANEAELTRIKPGESGPVTSRMMINIKEAENNSSAFLLQRDDYIFVRSIPDWNIYRSAMVTGRVLYPGNYAVKRGETLSSLLERTGGYAPGAFTKGAVFIRESIKADQQKNINEMILRLEREIMSSANMEVSTAVKQQDVAFAQASMTQKEKYLDALKKLKASGRLVVTLPEDYKLIKGSPYDIELQEGDRLHIPERPGTVQVIGSVMTPSAFIYKQGQPFNEYVRMAGGYSAFANPKRAYILKADGSALRAFSGNKARIIEEGDFIVIPEKVLYNAGMRNTTDIIDIVYKLVLGVAAVDYIFK